MRQIEKYSYLSSIDHLWIDHIDAIEGLREGVRLRGYAQRDPIAEFKNEAYGMFEGLVDRIDEEVCHRLFRIGVAMPQPSGPEASPGWKPSIPLATARTNVDQLDKTGLADMGEELTAEAGEPAFSKETSSRPSVSQGNEIGRPAERGTSQAKLGRNEPCPCGSGKKYKKCHYPQYG